MEHSHVLDCKKSNQKCHGKTSKQRWLFELDDHFFYVFSFHNGSFEISSSLSRLQIRIEDTTRDTCNSILTSNKLAIVIFTIQ